MSLKNTDKDFYCLSGQLQKLSTSIFIGYQSKFFSFLQNGTKIGYRNIDETQFKEPNIFLVKQVVVCEAEEDFSFTLETPRRTFTIKAKNQQMKVKWMRTITKIRKQIIRKKFKVHNKSIQKSKILPSSTQNTLPAGSLDFLHQTQRSMKSNYLMLTERSMRMSSNPSPNPQKDSEIKKDFSEMLKNIPQQFLKYNIYVANLKSKVQNLFTATFTSSTYILFSSKSLYPSEEASEQNLTNMMLPPWGEINKMYKMVVSGTNSTNNLWTPKLFLQISRIIDIEQSQQQKNSLRIRTSDNVQTFFCQTLEQKGRLKQIFTNAISNYKQVIINGKLTRKNYDQVVKLYHTQYDEFIQRVKQMIAKIIPNNHHYEPQVVVKFIDVSIPFIQQFILILGNKQQKCGEIIQQVLKQIHQQIKIHIKLTWDTSFSNMKNQDILRMLNALSAYHLIIKDYITDIEFMTGMKQLSKIYVRESWKNFEDIILGIVEQQKKNNIFVDQDNEYVETNSIIDLFKFIYEVYDLAAPCWDHKLHLHNVQKLMSRAISVFITELKASVDDTVISNKQLIAIANNYFRFSLTVDEFYSEKFSLLQQKTKESYDKLKVQYKELSTIILDKLAFDIRGSIKKFFQKGSFFKIQTQKLCQILRANSEKIEVSTLHPIFLKRFYQKLFTSVRQNILIALQKQISSKKKHNVTKILDQLDTISFDLIDIANVLYDGKTKIDKQLNEVNILLSCDNHNQIISMIKGSAQDLRKIYLNLINLREDYYVGGPLYYMINEENIQRGSVTMTSTNFQTKNSLRPMRLTISKQMEMRASFSNYYMSNDFDMASSVDKSQADSYQEPLKLISEGYLMKCKTNKRVWERQYFRLKNGTLYFYHNQKSEKCQNSIIVADMAKVFVSSQSLSFGISYTSLSRIKQIEFKCDSIQLRDRWLESLTLQIKRVKNDEKVKKQKLKLTQKNKNYLIIDYEELMNGKGYFSYTTGGPM